VLLRAAGSYQASTFSPDASIFAACTKSNLVIWRYASGQYIQWREFQKIPGSLQFSPTSSSILSCTGTTLRVLNLDYSTGAVAVESTTTVYSWCYDAFSLHGTFIATAYPGGNTITITNLNPQNPYPSQFIEIDLEISAMVLTGNVLLVAGSGKIVVWLLTEEGMVDGIVGNTRADYNDSLWEITPKAPYVSWADGDGKLGFQVEDEIAFIYLHGYTIHVYHTGTGEILDQNKDPKNYNQYQFYEESGRDDCNLYHHEIYKQQRPLE